MAKQHKAYKFRIYPDKEQVILIAKTIGCSRFVFNHFLAKWQEVYNQTGKGLSFSTCCSLLTQLKEELAWLKEVDSVATQASLKNLADAYTRFFKKQNQAPRFKSKNNNVQSYTTKATNNNIAIRDNKLKLPKLGFVPFAKSRDVNGRILRAMVKRNPSGKYFVSLLVETDIQPLEKTDSAIGIDLGITDFAIFSDGDTENNNRFTNKAAQKLKREQQKLARRRLQAKDNGIRLSDAKNYQKQKRKVARLYEKVTNQRNDFLNKLSTMIIKNHDVICIEDLNVKGMMRNKKLSKSIADVSWSSFVSKLTYKADWYGRELIKVSQWFPSSQRCSNCHHYDKKKDLNIRHWTCSNCHIQHDRDVNASRNILIEGLRLHALA